ncbi:MAG: hypothetical protein GTN86_07115 [Xanthomonadales bacterium]|nr:hypothetical protein [Xanthomonadales bacterium]NIN59638.1 hypothetical protein [Xanthomonadales bacterium]NIN75051.1 hypothetical protein [Xanthomonadales bacterium]NIO14139.1 hypothetical protein [Xanthomonadales bacterium]NIP12031.1 hypothetical protein [Xanthomonadales bacterium]
MLALLMALYFSGVAPLQQVVAPSVSFLPPYYWREFGLLEGLQNLCLLVTLLAALSAARVTRLRLDRMLLGLMMVGALFVLLEETDYGRHFFDLVRGQAGSLDPERWRRNLHSVTMADGQMLASWFKLAARLVLVTWFLLLPLLWRPPPGGWVARFLPSRWFTATVMLLLMVSALAHGLDDRGLGIIHGSQGNLHKNISEFGELLLYYLAMVYTVETAGRCVGGAETPDPAE